MVRRWERMESATGVVADVTESAELQCGYGVGRFAVLIRPHSTGSPFFGGKYPGGGACLSNCIEESLAFEALSSRDG